MKVWELMNILSSYEGDTDIDNVKELATPEKPKEETQEEDTRL